uniref:Transposase n=1 Tax=Haemonchus contortus TaxID=6289 RepID=A0A7I4YCE8_HAECO|nr:Unknown [Haemonchus contortus]
MFLTRALRGNLNIPHWNRRVWEIGYSGPPLPKRKATGRPNYPISKNQVAILRDRFAREYNVMKLLTRPYVTAEAESDYFASKNVTGLDQIREQEKARAEALRMPGKAKRVDGSKRAVRRRANVGNLLQKHITVEDSLAELMNRNCWD